MIDIYNNIVDLAEKKLLGPQSIADWQASGDFQAYLGKHGYYHIRTSNKVGKVGEGYVLHGKTNRVIPTSVAVQDINGLFYLPGDLRYYAFHNGAAIKTSSDNVWVHGCKMSRNFAINSNRSIPFAEHSGAGFGTPKVFIEPSGEAYGIEIECVFSGEDDLTSMSNKINFCIELNKFLPGWIAERDGSLEDGIKKNYPHLVHSCAEVVSPPLCYDDLCGQLEIVVRLLNKYSATAEYGEYFAIHITSNIPDNNARLKMLQTVMAKENRLFWLEASGRPNFHGFSSESSKPYCQFIELSHLHPNYQISLCSYHGNSSDHYRALFLRNSRAAELRIFKTKVDLSYIMAIVELNRKLYRFSHSEATDFAAFIKSTKS